jgi:hypothetical protein
VFELQTSERSFPGPDLHFGGVWHVLGISFSWAEILVPYHPAGHTSSPGGLGVHLLLAPWVFTLYSTFGGLFCNVGSIL